MEIVHLNNSGGLSNGTITVCNTSAGLQRTSIQFSVNPKIPLLHQYPKEVNTDIQMLVHKYSEHHYSQEPKGENIHNVHQQMKGEPNAVCSQNGILFSDKKDANVLE